MERCNRGLSSSVSLTMTVFLFTILARTGSFDSYEFVLLDRSETKVSMDAVVSFGGRGRRVDDVAHLFLCLNWQKEELNSHSTISNYVAYSATC